MMDIRKYKVTDAIFIYFAALLVGSILTIFVKFEKSPDATIFAGYFISQACFLASILIYSRYRRINLFYNIPFKRKASVFEIVTAIILSLCIFAFSMLPTLLYSWIMLKLGITAKTSLPALDSIGAKLAAVIFLCVLPSIAEEFLIRGVFLTAFEKYGGMVSLLFTAAVFAFMHLHLMQLLHQFIVGLILAYIVLRTQKLMLAIVIHFVNNIIALFLPMVIPAANNIALSANTFAILIPIMLLGLFLAICAIRVLIRAALFQEKLKGIKEYFSLWKDTFGAFARTVRRAFAPKGLANLKGDFAATLPPKNINLTASADWPISLAFLLILAVMTAFSSFI